jgi:hypothetical protein
VDPLNEYRCWSEILSMQFCNYIAIKRFAAGSFSSCLINTWIHPNGIGIKPHA